jgi:tetratricopeptide (TPR) repeat protein
VQKVSLSFVAIVAFSAIWTGGGTLGPESNAPSLQDLKAKEASFPTKLAASLGASSRPTTLGSNRAFHDGVSLGSKATPSADLHVAAARMSEQSGQLADAERHYQEALAIDSRHTDAVLSYGRLKDSRGQSDQALALYETAAKAAPNDAAIFNALGLSYARQRRFKESITALERAIHLDPKKGLYRNNVAMVLVETGAADAALSHLKAVQSEAIAHYNVGYILQKKGDSQAAARHFAQAAQQDPSLTAAGDWLAKLQAQRSGGAQPPTNIASAKRSPVPRSPMPQTSAPPPQTNAPVRPAPFMKRAPSPQTGNAAPFPPFLELPPAVSGGPNLGPPNPVVRKLPPVPQPLMLPGPPQQAKQAPLPPPTRVSRRIQKGEPVRSNGPLIYPLPPVEDNADLP